MKFTRENKFVFFFFEFVMIIMWMFAGIFAYLQNVLLFLVTSLLALYIYGLINYMILDYKVIPFWDGLAKKIGLR